MIEWFAPTGKPIHTLLTKSDKLTRQESVNALRATQKGLAEYRDAGYSGELTVQLFSALKRVGLDDAHALIEGWLADKSGQDEHASPAG
jgi:GTP-binding protein